MSLIYFVENTPIFEEEANQKFYSGELLKFDLAIKENKSFNLKFQNGILSATEFKPIDFTPIGIGKPLSIELMTFYTGEAPKKFLGKKDLLVISGVKALTTYDSAPIAINQIAKKIDDRTHYEPNAFNNGSPIVYYTPALDMGTILCSFQLVADTFNEKIFESVSSLLAKAGGIPIFAPASGVLLAGSVLSNMIAKLGKAIFESKPFFRGNFDIRLDSPGQLITKSKYIGIIDSMHTREFIDFIPGNVEVTPDNIETRLINKKSKKPYDGHAPYLLISVDGRERDDLKNFAPTIATASVIESFYGTDTNSQTVEVVQDAMNLYNDYNYFNKAKKQKKLLEGLDENSEAYINGMTLLEAYKKNIQEPEIFKV